MMFKTKKKIFLFVVILVAMSLFFAACTTDATPDVTTDEPDTGAPAGDDKMGGSITFTHLEPATLNPFIRPDLEAWAAAQMVTKGFVDLDPNGNWVPILASELPSLDNGTVSPDGLVITWKLRPNLKWSDGEPITVDDLIYTWEICSDPGSGCAWNAGFDKIESIESDDNETVVITYSEFHPDFVGQFRNGILPKHGTGPGTNMLEWDWNRTIDPGNGPYIVKEWVPSDYILFERNPNYYDAPKPYIDEVVWKIVPDFEVMRQMLISEDADAMAYLGEPESIQEMKDLGFTIHGSNAFNNRLQLNPYDPNDLTKPHPILGDPDVRRAIFMAVDREAVTYNWNIPGIFETELFTSMFDMWPAFACNIEPFPSDDEGA
jgi:peptide/nickel transport system substrate-binding protein